MRWSNPRLLARARTTVMTPSTRGASATDSETNRNGPESKITWSYSSSARSMKSMSNWLSSSSVEFVGRGPLGRTSRFGTCVWQTAEEKLSIEFSTALKPASLGSWKTLCSSGRRKLESTSRVRRLGVRGPVNRRRVGVARVGDHFELLVHLFEHVTSGLLVLLDAQILVQ